MGQQLQKIKNQSLFKPVVIHAEKFRTNQHQLPGTLAQTENLYRFTNFQKCEFVYINSNFRPPSSGLVSRSVNSANKYILTKFHNEVGLFNHSEKENYVT